MNRTILIVICDFLLVSLLAFSTVDLNEATRTTRREAAPMDAGTNQADSSRDLAAVMRMALDEEQRNREQLLGELKRTRDTLGEQQALLGERERQLREREAQVQTVQQQLSSREEQAAQLRQEQAFLQRQYAEAQTNLQTINQQLMRSSTDAVISQERLRAMEEELRKQAEQAAALQRQMAGLAESNQMVLAEKQRLASQLQVAEVEIRHASEQAARAQELVILERQEKAKLAEGVKALATRSDELVEEIRENRPLAANTIFSDFITNRVAAQFSAARSGVFGGATRQAVAGTVLVTDRTNIYAVCHVDETPFALTTPGTDWERLNGVLSRRGTQVPVRTVSFQFRDPRIAYIPVTAAEARALGGKVYQLTSDPFKFQDAVLVGAKEGYYGECRFEIDMSTPEHFRLDRSVLKGLFGKFNPSRGDLVFSKSGELLGVMANGTYCMRIRNFDAVATFHFDQNVRGQRTGEILSALSDQVLRMPLKLQ